MCDNFHWTLHVHMVGGSVYWALSDKHGSRESVMLARGRVPEPMAALYHSPGTHLMEAAYEAYRAVGD